MEYYTVVKNKLQAFICVCVSMCVILKVGWKKSQQNK